MTDPIEMDDVLEISSDERHLSGDVRANALTVSYGALRVDGKLTLRDFLHAGEGGRVEVGSCTVPLVLLAPGGALSGPVEAALRIEGDEYEEEDFERLVAALGAALQGVSLDALWDELEEDYEEEVDHLREDGTVEDALDILLSSGTPGILLDYIVNHGNPQAIGAALG